MYLNANHNVPHQVRPVHAPPTGWSFWNIDAVPQGQHNIPIRCFPYTNLVQEYCTAPPSVLCWEPAPRYLSDGLSIYSQTKSHSPLPVLLSCPPRDATKLSQLHEWSGHWSALQPSVGTDKVWWSLLSGTAIFSGGKPSSDGHRSK